LGVDGNVLIGHGSSSARAISQLILTATRVVDLNIPEAITQVIGD
jgi:fatty acid/phospholipid biosynthesis enzyme